MLEIILAILLVIVIAIGVFIIVTHRENESEEQKAWRAFKKFLKLMKIPCNRAQLIYIKQLGKEVHKRVMQIFTTSRDLIMTLDEPLEAAIYIASAQNNTQEQLQEQIQAQLGNKKSEKKDEKTDENKDVFTVKSEDFDQFFHCFGLIRNVDAFFDEKKMVEVYHKCKKSKKDVLEQFARAWVDQKNADLQIDFETAKEFIAKGRDFQQLVNLDIMAKRAGIDINEKNIVNDIDDNGLKIIIYALIRAKYEGIYMSEEESCKINKANVLEYNDTFRITVELLKSLYVLKRDINRFTNIMIRAHNAGVKINFSLNDLYSLSDEQFDILVSNIIKASDKGISIDQTDLIRQNIQGNDITQLVMALIKANEYNLDLTPDELMNYMINTHSDVVKFVKAYNFAVKNQLPSEDGTPLSKDHLVEYSRKDADLYDYVQGLKKAKDIEKEIELQQRTTDYGINYKNLKEHFKQFGDVLNTIQAVETANGKGIRMNFDLANKIRASEKYTLTSALAWAQNPLVVQVEPTTTCVCKNGVQVKPKVNITVRGKMPLIFAGYDIDILYKRINEAIIMEFESAEDHESILKTLPIISQNVINRINEEENKEIKTKDVKEEALNKVSRYELLDVNIYDIEIGQNIKAELELRQAQIDSEMRRLKAEADKAKAEADIRIAMVQQYKDGIKPNFNELHKANLLEGKSDAIITGYETIDS